MSRPLQCPPPLCYFIFSSVIVKCERVCQPKSDTIDYFISLFVGINNVSILNNPETCSVKLTDSAI